MKYESMHVILIRRCLYIQFYMQDHIAYCDIRRFALCNFMELLIYIYNTPHFINIICITNQNKIIIIYIDNIIKLIIHDVSSTIQKYDHAITGLMLLV